MPHTNTLMEFQGEFENFDMFDGTFDDISLTMHFKDFFLQGRIVEREFTIVEIKNGKIEEVKAVKSVVLFDTPPRFKLSQAN